MKIQRFGRVLLVSVMALFVRASQAAIFSRYTTGRHHLKMNGPLGDRVRLLAVALALVAGAGLASTPAHATKHSINGRIIFGRYNAAIDDFTVYTANSDGTDEVKVLDAESPRWSPDGQRIAVALGGEFVRTATMNPDGSDLVMLVGDPTLDEGFSAWSPDGQRVAFEGWDNVDPTRPAGIFSMRASDGGDLVRVTTNPYGGHDMGAAYSPDGTRILFTRENPLLEQTALFLVHIDGTGLRQLTAWSMQADGGRWSPTGKEIIFGSHGVLWLINPDGSKLQQVKLHDDIPEGFSFGPAWSPDGKYLLFSRYLVQDQETDLFTMKVNGTQIRQVTHTPEDETFADWGTYQGR